jgi:hypothetical protein
MRAGASKMFFTLPAGRASLLGILCLGANSCEEDATRAPTRRASACVPGDTLAGGYERCANGLVHRPAAGVCPSVVPRPGPADSGATTASDGGTARFVPSPTLECLQDSDCDAAPYGYCWVDVAQYCRYGCVTDSDCEADEVCRCGELTGSCQPAACRTDADCGAGLLCGSNGSDAFCAQGLACQTPEDECAGDADCPSGQTCVRLPLDPSQPALGLGTKRVCASLVCPEI